MDPVHSSINFAITHNGVATFRSGFDAYEARLSGGDAPSSRARSTSPASRSTRSSSRATCSPPTSSTPALPAAALQLERAERRRGRRRALRGELEIRGEVREVEASGKFGQLGADLAGNARVGLSSRPRSTAALRPRLERRAAQRRRGPRLRGRDRGRAGAGRGGRVTMRVLGISGSLRRDSLNSALLRAAAERLPAGAELVEFERLREIPPYDEDVEVEATRPWSRSCARRSRGRRGPDRDPGVQPLDPGPAQERPRLGLPPGREERPQRQAGRGDRRLDRHVRRGLGAGRAAQGAGRPRRPRGRGRAAGRPRQGAARRRPPRALAPSSPSSSRRSSPS